MTLSRYHYIPGCNTYGVIFVYYQELRSCYIVVHFVNVSYTLENCGV